MFLNLRRHQNYILDVFNFCDLCKFVRVYVFVVIKDANFTVIKSVTLTRINFINNIVPENQFGKVCYGLQQWHLSCILCNFLEIGFPLVETCATLWYKSALKASLTDTYLLLRSLLYENLRLVCMIFAFFETVYSSVAENLLFGDIWALVIFTGSCFSCDCCNIVLFSGE